MLCDIIFWAQANKSRFSLWSVLRRSLACVRFAKFDSIFFYYDILNRNVYMVIIMYVCPPWADITHVMCVSISVTTCYHFECKTV